MSLPFEKWLPDRETVSQFCLSPGQELRIGGGLGFQILGGYLVCLESWTRWEPLGQPSVASVEVENR